MKNMLHTEETKMIVLNGEQLDAIEIIDNLMKDLQKIYPNETIEYLINPATGEIVETREFGRIRGVLSFLSTEPFQAKLK